MNKIPISLKGTSTARDEKFDDGDPGQQFDQEDRPVTGYLTVASGLMGIFSLAILFVPLTLILCVVAMIKDQWSWAFAGLFLAVIGFFTSPLLLGIVGLSALLMAFPLPF